MILTALITGKRVGLTDMLDARSARAERQRELLQSNPQARSLISFTMNIAGEFKSYPLVLAAFDEALTVIRRRLPPDSVLYFEESRPFTGPQAFFLLSGEARTVKQAMTAIEESHPLGRLFDIDVLEPSGASVSRAALGLPARACLICGGEAKACARSRNHTLEMITWRTVQMLDGFFQNRAADQAAACAVRALLYEVSATPKPGLVDRNNSGSHRDMDFFTFLDSSAALIPAFRDFFCIGWEHADEPEARLFSRLRYAGQEAERRMFAATGGVNTHKGLIFSSAILCGALGKVHSKEAAPLPETEILSVCRKLGTCAMRDFGDRAAAPKEPVIPNPKGLSPASGRPARPTAGMRCQALYGITGARGEAAGGFPTVCRVGLPALKSRFADGYSLNDAAVLTLLTLLTAADDTNMVHRGGKRLADASKAEAARILKTVTPENFEKTLTALDADFIQKNLSPGGCADLLALSLLFYFLEEAGLAEWTNAGEHPRRGHDVSSGLTTIN